MGVKEFIWLVVMVSVCAATKNTKLSPNTSTSLHPFGVGRNTTRKLSGFLILISDFPHIESQSKNIKELVKVHKKIHQQENKPELQIRGLWDWIVRSICFSFEVRVLASRSGLKDSDDFSTTTTTLTVGTSDDSGNVSGGLRSKTAITTQGTTQSTFGITNHSETDNDNSISKIEDNTKSSPISNPSTLSGHSTNLLPNSVHNKVGTYGDRVDLSTLPVSEFNDFDGSSTFKLRTEKILSSDDTTAEYRLSTSSEFLNEPSVGDITGTSSPVDYGTKVSKSTVSETGTKSLFSDITKRHRVTKRSHNIDSSPRGAENPSTISLSGTTPSSFEHGKITLSNDSKTPKETTKKSTITSSPSHGTDRSAAEVLSSTDFRPTTLTPHDATKVYKDKIKSSRPDFLDEQTSNLCLGGTHSSSDFTSDEISEAVTETINITKSTKQSAETLTASSSGATWTQVNIQTSTSNYLGTGSTSTETDKHTPPYLFTNLSTDETLTPSESTASEISTKTYKTDTTKVILKGFNQLDKDSKSTGTTSFKMSSFTETPPSAFNTKTLITDVTANSRNRRSTSSFSILECTQETDLETSKYDTTITTTCYQATRSGTTNEDVLKVSASNTNTASTFDDIVSTTENTIYVNAEVPLNSVKQDATTDQAVSWSFLGYDVKQLSDTTGRLGQVTESMYGESSTSSSTEFDSTTTTSVPFYYSENFEYTTETTDDPSTIAKSEFSAETTFPPSTLTDLNNGTEESSSGTDYESVNLTSSAESTTTRTKGTTSLGLVENKTGKCVTTHLPYCECNLAKTTPADHGFEPEIALRVVSSDSSSHDMPAWWRAIFGNKQLRGRKPKTLRVVYGSDGTPFVTFS